MSFSKSVLRDRLSGLLKDHSCVTAPLKATKDFRIALDDKDVIVFVAVDPIRGV